MAISRWSPHNDARQDGIDFRGTYLVVGTRDETTATAPKRWKSADNVEGKWDAGLIAGNQRGKGKEKRCWKDQLRETGVRGMLNLFR
jgi:hypothetical protein